MKQRKKSSKTKITKRNNIRKNLSKIKNSVKENKNFLKLKEGKLQKKNSQKIIRQKPGKKEEIEKNEGLNYKDLESRSFYISHPSNLKYTLEEKMKYSTLTSNKNIICYSLQQTPKKQPKTIFSNQKLNSTFSNSKMIRKTIKKNAIVWF